MGRDLNDVQVFVRVVEAGSFTAAGKQLQLPTSTVSRRVARLEEQLDVRLLQRTTRKLSLTEAGQLYFERSVRVLAELDEAENILSQARQSPKGRVRLAVPLEQGITMQLVNDFLQLCPEVRVEAEFTSRNVNIIEEGFDASIHAGPLANLSVVAFKLIESNFSIVSSENYLARKGRPQSLAELGEHDCLIFGPSSVNAYWELSSGNGALKLPVRGRFAANSLQAVKEAALAGHGLALLPHLACVQELESGQLIRLFPKSSPPAVPIYLTYPAGRFLPAAVRAFVDFVKERFVIYAKGNREPLQIEQ